MPKGHEMRGKESKITSANDLSGAVLPISSFLYIPLCNFFTLSVFQGIVFTLDR